MSRGVTPEAPLWAMLDKAGIPFREPLGALIERYGTKPLAWSPQMQVCTLPGKPLLRGLSAFGVQWRAGDDLTLPPFGLMAWLRRHSVATPLDWIFDRRAQRNYADVRTGLGRLGWGKDISTSNALTREWRFGMASLIATAFPAYLNRTRAKGPNSRHVLEPGSQWECALTLHPGWLPPLTAEQLGWVADFRRIGVPPTVFFSPGYAPPRWNRSDVAPGYGPSADGRGFVVATGEFARVVARADITAVRRDVMTPARGSGQVELVVVHAPTGVPDVRPHEIRLDFAPYGRELLLAEAHALAAALGMPLTETEWPDS